MYLRLICSGQRLRTGAKSELQGKASSIICIIHATVQWMYKQFFLILFAGSDRSSDAVSVLLQGWVPSLLLHLLHRAASAHSRLRDQMLARDRDADAGIPSYPALTKEEEGAVYALLDSGHEAFFYLALANTKRTARLAASPHLLARWAVEILTGQSEAALTFVQEYDKGSLGLGDVLASLSTGDGEGDKEEEEVKHMFKELKQATDTVVNSLFVLRKMLKVRSGVEREEGHFGHEQHWEVHSEAGSQGENGWGDSWDDAGNGVGDIVGDLPHVHHQQQEMRPHQQQGLMRGSATAGFPTAATAAGAGAWGSAAVQGRGGRGRLGSKGLGRNPAAAAAAVDTGRGNASRPRPSPSHPLAPRGRGHRGTRVVSTASADRGGEGGSGSGSSRGKGLFGRGWGRGQKETKHGVQGGVLPLPELTINMHKYQQQPLVAQPLRSLPSLVVSPGGHPVSPGLSPGQAVQQEQQQQTLTVVLSNGSSSAASGAALNSPLSSAEGKVPGLADYLSTYSTIAPSYDAVRAARARAAAVAVGGVPVTAAIAAAVAGGVPVTATAAAAAAGSLPIAAAAGGAGAAGAVPLRGMHGSGGGAAAVAGGVPLSGAAAAGGMPVTAVAAAIAAVGVPLSAAAGGAVAAGGGPLHGTNVGGGGGGAGGVPFTTAPASSIQISTSSQLEQPLARTSFEFPKTLTEGFGSPVGSFVPTHSFTEGPLVSIDGQIGSLSRSGVQGSNRGGLGGMGGLVITSQGSPSKPNSVPGFSATASSPFAAVAISDAAAAVGPGSSAAAASGGGGDGGSVFGGTRPPAAPAAGGGSGGGGGSSISGGLRPPAAPSVSAQTSPTGAKVGSSNSSSWAAIVTMEHQRQQQQSQEQSQEQQQQAAQQLQEQQITAGIWSPFAAASAPFPTQDTAAVSAQSPHSRRGSFTSPFATATAAAQDVLGTDGSISSSPKHSLVDRGSSGLPMVVGSSSGVNQGVAVAVAAAVAAVGGEGGGGGLTSPSGAMEGFQDQYQQEESQQKQVKEAGQQQQQEQQVMSVFEVHNKVDPTSLSSSSSSQLIPVNLNALSTSTTASSSMPASQQQLQLQLQMWQQEQQRQQQQQQHIQQQQQQQLLRPQAAALVASMQDSEDAFWHVRWKELEQGITGKLGSGSYGHVYRVSLRFGVRV